MGKGDSPGLMRRLDENAARRCGVAKIFAVGQGSDIPRLFLAML
jgi:hypothetical protein